MSDGKAAAEIEKLLAVHPKGFDLSLERIRALLEKLGNPHHAMPPVIHVAGTNGKGSTVAFMRVLLEAQGLRVHVDTSPHLVRWHERYRLAGTLVEDDVLADAVARAAAANDGAEITVFEVLSAVAFMLFAEHEADVCLVEVGLGGRFDCTNVMEDEAIAVSVITPVAMDHESFLGDTLAKIAGEKAGIIRRETPLIVGQQQDEALAVIERQAARLRAPVEIFGEHFSVAAEDGRMLFHGEDVMYDLAPPALPGRHQYDNAATAVAAVRRFLAGRNEELTADVAERGVLATLWPGRLQRLREGALVDAADGAELWVDGGHNPHAGAAVADFFAARPNGCGFTMVLGMLNTKDPAGYLAPLAALAPRIICVPITTSDAGIAPDELADAARALGLEASVAEDVSGAVATAAGASRIVIAGSLYLAGDALAANGTPPT